MKRQHNNVQSGCYLLIMIVIILIATPLMAVDYPIVDTGQQDCFDNSQGINPPELGAAFYGQDAQFNDNQLQPAYVAWRDGTVEDLNSGLTWVRARGEKMTWADAVSGAEECNVGGHDDWRMPTIKELYSLIDFRGYINPEGNGDDTVPYIDTEFFMFEYGDVNNCERIIDCQDWSATEYVHFTMNNDSTVFGVNFADGRIKGYPKYRREMENIFPNELYVRYVRGNPNYGINDFQDNGDNTVTDRATGLMWMKDDSEEGLNWEEALAAIQSLNEDEDQDNHDWRMPNAKELQSIVDYTRAPAVTNSPAIDPIFECSVIQDEGGGEDYPFYWTNTTHFDGPQDRQYNNAIYVTFGRALGWMQPPPRFEWELWDVHGAGAQRSDPKIGNPNDYPHGNGPQGDVIRVYNYVRPVRGFSEPNSVDEDQGAIPTKIQLLQSYPNPFNSTTTISYQLPEMSRVCLSVFDLNGKLIATLFDDMQSVGSHQVIWNADAVPSGVYMSVMSNEEIVNAQKLVLIR